jgi:hypothetical protein
MITQGTAGSLDFVSNFDFTSGDTCWDDSPKNLGNDGEGHAWSARIFRTYIISVCLETGRPRNCWTWSIWVLDTRHHWEKNPPSLCTISSGCWSMNP